MGEPYIAHPRDNGRRKAKRVAAEFFQILGRGNGKKRMARYVTQSIELHGTPEQRQARTRAAVRANIRAANKEDT